MKAIEISNRVAISRRVTKITTSRYYLNFLLQNIARAPERYNILSVTNYPGKITNNVVYLVTKLHAMLTYSVRV